MLLIDNQLLPREYLDALLTEGGDVRLAAIASDASEALNMLSEGLKVSIILVDVITRNLSGLELTRKLKTSFPEIKVVILTALRDKDIIAQAFKNGAKGYLLREVGMRELRFALQHIKEGNRYLCSKLAVANFDNYHQFESPNGMSNIRLSKREFLVLKFISYGLTTTEIAELIYASKRTVEGIRLKLLTKTGARNSANLVKFAMQHQLLNSKLD